MEQKHKFYLAIKYTLDKLIALICLLVFSPLFLIVSILVACDGRGSVIFRQEREGRNREIFYIYKFRTMKRTDIAFDKENAVIASDNKNVTLVGRVLRRTKIDELPQLLNILKGDMSFVGPRPLLPVYSKMFEKWEYYKFSGKPGMTGLAQVHGNGSLSVRGRSYYDIVYNEKVSLFMDIKVFCLTFVTLLFGEKHCVKEPTEEQISAMKEKYDG